MSNPQSPPASAAVSDDLLNELVEDEAASLAYVSDPSNWDSSGLTQHDKDCMHFVAAKLAALRELQQLREQRRLAGRKGWRPIETAPKDGRIIIGWSAGWESATAIQWVPALSYEGEYGPVTEKADWDWNGTIQCPPSHDPTHWRPLPPPPSPAPCATCRGSGLIPWHADGGTNPQSSIEPCPSCASAKEGA